MKQNTIRDIAAFSGVGLHSGVMVHMAIKPAPANTGIVFRRLDLDTKNNEIKVDYNSVINTNLGTTIGTANNCQRLVSNFLIKFGVVKEYGIVVRTIEHLMASLWACNIDNAIIELDNKEIPIMDGSSDVFIRKIKEVGIQEQEENRRFLVVKKEVSFKDKGRYIKLMPYDGYKIDLEVDFKYGGIGRQFYSFNGNQEDFINEISMARTFCNIKDVEFMKKHNLAKGGSEDNAMIFDENKIINKNGFRVNLEPVKHKLIDCVGDMFTSGYYMKCHIQASKTGHTIDNKILHRLFSDKSNYEII